MDSPRGGPDAAYLPLFSTLLIKDNVIEDVKFFVHYFVPLGTCSVYTALNHQRLLGMGGYKIADEATQSIKSRVEYLMTRVPI